MQNTRALKELHEQLKKIIAKVDLVDFCSTRESGQSQKMLEQCQIFCNHVYVDKRFDISLILIFYALPYSYIFRRHFYYQDSKISYDYVKALYSSLDGLLYYTK